MQIANAQVSSAEQPILQQIHAERQANLAKAQQQMGFAKAAAAIAQGIAPRVQDTYTNAANADAGYARGLGDSTQGAINQQTTADNSFLSKMGTPTAGLVHPANVGGTAYGLEGYIPASTLQREGAGFGAAAQMLPGDILSQGRQSATASVNDTTNIAKLQSELATLAATKPEVYQKAMTMLEGFAYKNAALNQAQQRIAQGQQRIGISQQSLALRAQLGQASLNLRAQSIAQTAFNENRSYGLALKRLGLEGKRLQMSALKSEVKAKGGGFTPDELVTIRGKSGALAYKAFNGVPAHGTTPASKPLSFQQAFKLQILDGIPPSIALKQLKAAGYSIPIKGDGTGMFTKLAKYLAGSAGGGQRGGMANLNSTPGVAEALGQGIGGKFAHSNNAGGFLPRGQKFTYDRHDQGRDIQTRPGSAIIAPGSGYVVRWGSDPGGGGGHFGPRYPIVHFTSGPYAGQDVYIGHTVAAMRPGQRFSAGAVLSHTQMSGPLNGGAPSGWAEIGFAPGGTPGAFDQPAPF